MFTPSFDPSKVKIYDAMDLRKLELPKDYFILGPRLLPRGKLACFGGLTGIGKTFVALNLIRAFTLAEAPFMIPEWSAEPCKVLYIDKELDRYMVGDRVKHIFTEAEEDRVKGKFQVLTETPSMSLSKQDWVNYLRDYCNNEGINVLILDPISRMHMWEENAHGIYVVEALAEIAQSKTSIIVTHHFRKPPTGRDANDYESRNQYNFRGSVGTRLIEDASLVMTFEYKHPLPPKHKDHKNWVMAVSLAKTRHGTTGDTDFDVAFNENEDNRVIAIPKRKVKPLVTTATPKKRFNF